MHPELFGIPFTSLTIKSYGLMMVLGFLAAMFVIRRLSRSMGHSSEHITNAALYSLLSGLAGARAFYVVHYWESFQGRWLSIFAIWQGGLELLGGVILAIIVIIVYMRRRKLPVRRYLDILAIGLMLALASGRVGCFLNGCCFGRPTTCPMTVRFPYASPAFRSQIAPDTARERAEPYFRLPAEYFESLYLKDYADLTDAQKHEVDRGQYRMQPVFPTQLYSCGYALLICFLLYRFRRRGSFATGSTFGLMFILYGFCRFFMEFIRDDNPRQAFGLTVSQNIGIGLVIFGAAFMFMCSKFACNNNDAKEPAPSGRN